MTHEMFLERLDPCIERGDLDACVEVAARLAKEARIEAKELLALSSAMGKSTNHKLAYVLALAASEGLAGADRAQSLFNAGLAAQYIEEKAKAEEKYEMALEIKPNYADAHLNYANLLNDLGRKSEAEEHYKKALEIKPNDAEAHYSYAILLEGLERKGKAEEHYKKALEFKPSFAEAHTNYAILLNDLGRKKEAEEHYKKALEISPNLVEAHSNYANLLNDLGRKSEAEEHYKKALEIKPSIASVHNNYADFLRKNSRFSEAEKEAMISLKLEPGNPYGLATLGDIMADEEYHEEAIIEYQKALKSSSNRNPSLESEIHNNLGWAYAQLEQYKKAEGEFKKARILNPMNVKAIRNLRALGKSKRFMTEISRTQICISAVPMLLLILAYIFFFIGKLSETVFVAQFTILIAIYIFVLYSNQLSRFKMGTMELEMNEREPKSTLIATVSKMER